jgi:hypothetical protein
MDELSSILFQNQSQTEFLKETKQWMNTHVDNQLDVISNFLSELDESKLDGPKSYRIAQLITELSSSKNPKHKEHLAVFNSGKFNDVIIIICTVMSECASSSTSSKYRDNVNKVFFLTFAYNSWIMLLLSYIYLY